MFEIYHFSEPEIFSFILVLIRLSACFLAWPILGSEQIPGQIKVLVPLLLAFIIFPIVGWKQIANEVIGGELPLLVIREATVGLILGYVARFFFMALGSLGEMVSLAVGISTDQLLNPTIGGRTTIVEQFYVLLGSVLFLALNGHHILISGLVQSFEVIPLSSRGLSTQSMGDLAMMLKEVPIAGLKLAAPVVVAMFIINISMGIVSRIVPQINILITSLSVILLVGFFIMIVSLPLVLDGMHGLIDDMLKNIFNVMKVL